MCSVIPANKGILSKVKSAVCSATPNGRTVGVNGSLGLIAGPVGSVEQVVNYDTASVSYFASGGLQAGWNGGAQGNVFGGVIYGDLGSSNQNCSGPFNTVSGSGALVGGYAQSGGGIKVFGGSTGVTLLFEVVPFTFAVSRTVTSKPLQGGSVSPRPDHQWIN